MKYRCGGVANFGSELVIVVEIFRSGSEPGMAELRKSLSGFEKFIMDDALSAIEDLRWVCNSKCRTLNEYYKRLT